MAHPAVREISFRAPAYPAGRILPGLSVHTVRWSGKPHPRETGLLLTGTAYEFGKRHIHLIDVGFQDVLSRFSTHSLEGGGSPIKYADARSLVSVSRVHPA